MAAAEAADELALVGGAPAVVAGAGWDWGEIEDAGSVHAYLITK